MANSSYPQFSQQQAQDHVDPQWPRQSTQSLQGGTSPTLSFDSLWNNSDQHFKKAYNKSLRESNKFQKSKSKCWFLKQCISQNVIPVTLRSKTNHKKFNQRVQSIWDNNDDHRV